MEFGEQYNKDDAFKAAARLHQSEYRANILQLDYNSYGNRLTDVDAKALLNYYDGLNCRETLRKRFSSYSQKRDADMLRSEHIPFNLLAPLDMDEGITIKILKSAFGIECEHIHSVNIEYAPPPKENYLNDMTAFDTFILASLPNNKRCGIGIEVKYTEKEYKIGKSEKKKLIDFNSTYWRTTRSSECFVDPLNKLLGSDPLRQIWRNHLLGLSMKLNGEIDEFYSITLFPDGNKHFHTVLPQYLDLLKPDQRQYVFGCTFEKYINSIDGDDEFKKWKSWLKQRYIV